MNPIVTIEMENGGVMRAELYPDIAPNTVNNFISLIQKGFYDGVGFHRIIPGFMIQGGDPQGTGMGGPGYPGERVYPPQPMLTQTRHVMEQYQENGGVLHEVVLHSGHGPFLDNREAFVEELTRFFEVTGIL